jgi:hypothetical protein
MSTKKPKRLRDVVKGVGDWERGKNSAKELAKRQKEREQALKEAMRIDQSSYGRRVHFNDRNPDYVGPMSFAGKGTRDRMPGTTPSNNPYNSTKSKPPSKKPKSKPKQDPRNYI